MHKNVACDSKVSGFDAREELRVASCNTVNDVLMQSLASFGHLELLSTPARHPDALLSHGDQPGLAEFLANLRLSIAVRRRNLINCLRALEDLSQFVRELYR